MLSRERIVDFGTYRYLDVRIEEGIAEVAIRCGDYDARGHWELSEIYRDLDIDTRVRSSLIYWADPPQAYDSGFDVYVAPTGNGPERFAGIAHGFREGRDGVYNIINALKPSVSLLRGEVPLGAGLAAALLADISVAADDAIICDSHVSMGLVAGDHGVLWASFIGIARAKRLLLASEAITGVEAAQMGLVSRAAPDTDVWEIARGYARKLADEPLNAVRMTKRALNQHLKQAALVSFDISITMEQLGMFDGDLDAAIAEGQAAAVSGGRNLDASARPIPPSQQVGDFSHPE